MRGGALRAFSDLAKTSKRSSGSSLGAMMGNRRGFAETLRLFCTRLAVIWLVLWSVMYRQAELEHLLGYSVQYINGQLLKEERNRGKLKIEKKL